MIQSMDDNLRVGRTGRAMIYEDANSSAPLVMHNRPANGPGPSHHMMDSPRTKRGVRGVAMHISL